MLRLSEDQHARLQGQNKQELSVWPVEPFGFCRLNRTTEKLQFLLQEVSTKRKGDSLVS